MLHLEQPRAPAVSYAGSGVRHRDRILGCDIRYLTVGPA